MQLDVSPADSGSITLNGDSFESYPANQPFYGSIRVTLEAIPAPGYYFTNWSGAVSGTTNPIYRTITCNSSITANFSPLVHTISLDIEGNGSTEPATGIYEYNEGDIVSITAIPDDGWQFDGWTGNVTDSQATTTTLTVNSDETVTATFSQIAYTISLKVDGNGSIEPAAGTHQYTVGETISITAIPDEGWQFDEWIGNVIDPQSTTATIRVSSNKTVTAKFTPIMHTISLQVDGKGSVEPTAGTYEYSEGETISITAIPDEGWQFDGWTGDVTDPLSTTTTLTVTSDMTVTARFSQVEPDWLQILHTIYNEVTAMFTALINLF